MDQNLSVWHNRSRVEFKTHGLSQWFDQHWPLNVRIKNLNHKKLTWLIRLSQTPFLLFIGYYDYVVSIMYMNVEIISIRAMYFYNVYASACLSVFLCDFPSPNITNGWKICVNNQLANFSQAKQLMKIWII